MAHYNGNTLAPPTTNMSKVTKHIGAVIVVSMSLLNDYSMIILLGLETAWHGDLCLIETVPFVEVR